MLAVCGQASAQTSAPVSQDVRVVFSETSLGSAPVVVSPKVLRSGVTRFAIFNESPKVSHTIFVARFEGGTTELGTSESGRTANTQASKLTILAKYSNVRPKETVRLRFDLWPGRYVIFCTRKGHFAKEGAATFEVTK